MSVHYTCPNYPESLLGSGVGFNQSCSLHGGPCHEQGWPYSTSKGAPPQGDQR